MTDWFDSAVSLDAGSAAVIARAMRAVARADGLIHQREMNLIASFEAHLPPGLEAPSHLTDDESLRLLFLRSLIMVALADGVISDAELAEIRTLAIEQSIPEDRIGAEILVVKRRFLSVFAGVNVFRDAVVRVARDLGLTDAEVDALSQEA